MTTHGDALLAGVVGMLFLVEILTEERFAGDRAGRHRRSAALRGDARRSPARAAARAARWRWSDRAVQPVGAARGQRDVPVRRSQSRSTPRAGTPTAAGAGRRAGGRGRAAARRDRAGRAVQPGRLRVHRDLLRRPVGRRPGDTPSAATRTRARGARGALELERDAKAREAVAEERARIARELHDVVAHAISVIVLQARGGGACSRPSRRRRAARSTPSSTPAGRRWPRCAGCSGCCGETDEEVALAPRPSLARIDDARRPAAAVPGCPSR